MKVIVKSDKKVLFSFETSTTEAEAFESFVKRNGYQDRKGNKYKYESTLVGPGNNITICVETKG